MNNAEYERIEAARLRKDLQDIERAPLADRREAKEALVYSLKYEREVIIDRLDWLLNGTYGKGAYDAAHAIRQNKRMNRAAAIFQLLAALEWRCSAPMTRAAWLALPAKDGAALNLALVKALDEWKEDE